jgi:hypothetical protein
MVSILLFWSGLLPYVKKETGKKKGTGQHTGVDEPVFVKLL